MNYIQKKKQYCFPIRKGIYLSKRNAIKGLKSAYKCIRNIFGGRRKARKNNNDNCIELFIFGHSLDSTDKDVLREFLLNDDIVTTIFYYNQEVYERKLANLVKVLGSDELLFRMYGKNPSTAIL